MVRKLILRFNTSSELKPLLNMKLRMRLINYHAVKTYRGVEAKFHLS
jgi:hypothetical protein